jgi:hypothetical protein
MPPLRPPPGRRPGQGACSPLLLPSPFSSLAPCPAPLPPCPLPPPPNLVHEDHRHAPALGQRGRVLRGGGQQAAAQAAVGEVLAEQEGGAVEDDQDDLVFMGYGVWILL